MNFQIFGITGSTKPLGFSRIGPFIAGDQSQDERDLGRNRHTNKRRKEENVRT
jgi:hypothetical protein